MCDTGTLNAADYFRKGRQIKYEGRRIATNEKCVKFYWPEIWDNNEDDTISGSLKQYSFITLLLHLKKINSQIIFAVERNFSFTEKRGNLIIEIFLSEICNLVKCVIVKFGLNND